MSVKRVAVLLMKYGLLALGLAATAGISALTTMRVVLTSFLNSYWRMVMRRASDLRRALLAVSSVPLA